MKKVSVEILEKMESTAVDMGNLMYGWCESKNVKCSNCELYDLCRLHATLKCRISSLKKKKLDENN